MDALCIIFSKSYTGKRNPRTCHLPFHEIYCNFGDVIETKVRKYIESHDLLRKEDNVIVGLSGGADSVSLLSILRNLGIRCIAAHCNFHLRGAESDRDETFCRELCEKSGVKLIVQHFDVGTRMKSTGESIEMACRTLRYDWWNSMIAKGIGDYIAVGHHREDNIETFFINLLRGCGLRGLKGMQPCNGRIIRPLLDITRQEIESYLLDKGIGYVTDSTNLEDEFRRNKLRLNILPLIEKEFPGGMDAISRTIDNLTGNHTLYRHLTEEMRKRFTDDCGRIDVRTLSQSMPCPDTALFELISPWGLNISHAKNILASLDDDTRGGKWYGGCLLDRGLLYPPVTCESETCDCIKISHISPEEFRSILSEKSINPDAIYLDSDAVDTTRLRLRRWRHGDRIAPFGMKGTRLVSDILSDAKLSMIEKRDVRILEYDGMVLWVVGMRPSRHFPITKKTRKVAVITCPR